MFSSFVYMGITCMGLWALRAWVYEHYVHGSMFITCIGLWALRAWVVVDKCSVVRSLLVQQLVLFLLLLL